MLKHFLFAFVLASMVAPSATAQTVDLATRTFWIGERPKSMEVDSPFVALLDIDWIDEILGAEPVFKGTVLQIEQEQTPYGTHSVAWSVAHLLPQEVELNPEVVPPEFRIPGYRVYGIAKHEEPDLVYVPNDPDAGFKVRCGRVFGENRLNVCSIYATYAPDDNIRLKAALYFPPNPADQPTRFRDVVERLREVAYCLDVTENLVDVPTVYPDLKGCRPEEVS